MEIKLIKKEDGRVIGYEMKGENPEEMEKLCHIRDMNYAGLIKYNGRRDSDDKNMNPGILSWIDRNREPEENK